MANKKKITKEGITTLNVGGYVAGAKPKHDPYSKGRSLNKRGSQKKPWYLKSMKDLEEATKQKLTEMKKSSIKEIVGPSDRKTQIVGPSDRKIRKEENPMDKFKDNLSKKMFGKSRSDVLKNKQCVMCHQPAESFKDSISEKEYSISGMCQNCQDQFFGGDEENFENESKSLNFSSFIKEEGGLSSLLNVDNKDAKTLPKKQVPFEKGKLANKKDFTPKFERTKKPQDK